MSTLSGDLQVMELSDVLGWLARRGRTGTLHVTVRSTQKRLVVNGGLLDATFSNDPRDMLGQFLVRNSLISEQQLFEALLLQETDKRMLGAILMAQGLITAEQLTQTLRQCAEETVYDLFLWPEGLFEFRAHEAGPASLLPLRLELAPLIDEGTWRHTQWQRMRNALPSPEVTFRARPGATAADTATHRLLELAAAGHSMGRMSLETRRSPFETAAHLLALCEQGLLEVDRPVRDDAATDAVAAIDRLLVTAAERLNEGRHEGAMAAYESVLALDPLNQQAKKGLVAVADARKRERLGRRVPLERVPVLVMGSMALTQQGFDPQEGFVLSRINGEWNVRSILKLCPLPEDQALAIFARLLDRRVIALV